MSIQKPSTRLVIISTVILGIVVVVSMDYLSALPPGAQPSFVGRDRCINCHRQQAELFKGSHHDLAMDLATDETVIGDFGDVSLEHHGVTSRMFRDGERFMIHTEGPDGQMSDFHIKYVFGVDPLQQYMVEFDRTDDMPEEEVARLQVLRVSWDTHKKKWFHLDPPDVNERLAPDDDLHWTGIAQRWNTMCAECHSTNLQKNYDHNQTQYHTTWSEIDVSCEACHGPGSIHVELAESRSLFWDRHHGYGLAQLKGENSIAQIEACAPCHSRRRVVHSGFQPGDRFCDFFEPELLGETTYHANGEILDEVYVYGSFLQSKMFHKGIRCSDCHDPHSLKLKFPGNQTCTSCHAHPAGKYDTPSHHKHAPGSSGALCVECHMPETTYMAVDPRRDHSIRVPRPDLSVEHATPNACTGCHVELAVAGKDGALQQRFPKLAELLKNESDSDRSQHAHREYSNWLEQSRLGNREIAAALLELDQWCDDACESWYGQDRKTPTHYAEALDAARRGQPDASKKLASVAQGNEEVPDIAKATALYEMRRLLNDNSLAKVARKALDDSNPMVRVAALRFFEGRDPGQIVRTVGPFLSDDSRLVRSEAGRILSAVPPDLLRGGQADLVQAAVQEYHDSLMVTNDRASAHLAWSVILENQGRLQEAVSSYETAMRVQPGFVGPRSNLATLLESMINSQRVAPGMVIPTQERIRQLRQDELPLLQRDASLAPNNGPLQYRLGLLLYLNEQGEEGLKALRGAVQLEPENEQFRMALVLLLQKLQHLKEARAQCKLLLKQAPNNPSYQSIWESLNP